MRLRELLWPQQVICLCCGGLTHGDHLCADCRKGLDDLRLPQHHAGPGALFAASVWTHEGEARHLVHALKYNAVAAAALPLAGEMAGLIREMSLPDDTVLTWVPMPEGRRLERGIDHGQCLAEEIARILTMPVRPLLGRRDNRFGKPQEGLTRVQRLDNLRHAFLSRGSIDHPVLLVDDVLTTGATVTACTECLLLSGAPRVQAVTATRAVFRKSLKNPSSTPCDKPSDMEETT